MHGSIQLACNKYKAFTYPHPFTIQTFVHMLIFDLFCLASYHYLCHFVNTLRPKY
jgi:hypothetical protein